MAKNMSLEDQPDMENIDMEKMISHVTQNVFKMMGNIDKKDLPFIPKKNEIELPKTKDICFDLNVDLEDFYTGKKKKLNVKRKRIIEVDGRQKVVEEKKKITINIEKGMKDEQQIRFESEADQIPGYTAGDIIITLIENEHPVFQRESNNLIIVKNINIAELYNLTFDIKHIDSRTLRISKDNLESLHTNDCLRKITGEGMPIYNSEGFGDLFIRFNLVIPKSITQEKLTVLKKLFESKESLQESFDKAYTLENISETDLEEFGLNSDSESEYESNTDSELSELSDSEPE